MNVSAGNLYFDEEIKCWDEALPLGNGFCGALIWGPADALRFSLDRGDLWDDTVNEDIYDAGYTYENMVKLAGEGNVDEIHRIFDEPYNHALPTKLPAGKLILNLGSNRDQRSELSVEDAQASVFIGDTVIRAFVHADKPIGMIKVTGCDSVKINIENPDYGLNTETQEASAATGPSTSSLKLLKYPPVQKFDMGNVKGFTQKTSGGEYGVFAAVSEKNGSTEIAWTIASSCDGENWQDEKLNILKDALNNGYDAEFAVHSKWWHNYWMQSGVDLPEPIFNKNWYLTQYLFGSCSRKGFCPMPLQGVWTADDGKLPPWKGDYHNDLNTELSYYPYLKAGHFPEGECFLDYLWNLRDTGRKFAKSFYGAPGICMPGTMTQKGDSLGGWGMYSLSPTNQIWLCQSFERYWRYTGDRDFLKNKAYPYLCETADFILHLLEEKDGKYYLPISSSPEIHDDEPEAFLTPNSNYDLSLMRYLFKTLGDMSCELNDGRSPLWQEHLSKLPELAVDTDGVLMLSPDERLTESHRHFSHMMSVHPLRLLDYDDANDKRVIDESIHEIERLGTGNWVGYSFTWLSEIYAIQRNGNGAAYQLRVFWENHCSCNGFHLNGDYKKRGTSWYHYRPFTLEGNMCAADAVQEMLMQTENGSLYLFPAVPDEWKKKRFSFTNLRAENGVSVSAVWDREIKGFSLNALRDTEIRIRVTDGVEKLLKGCQINDGWSVVTLRAGETLNFGISC